MAKNNYEFDFLPAAWLPSRDVEMLDRVRNIKREGSWLLRRWR